jgi:hypothetical protein
MAILSDIIIINSMQLSTEQQTLSFLSLARFFVSLSAQKTSRKDFIFKGSVAPD